MKQILKVVIATILLATPTKLSSIKIPYKPTYPACIMQVGDTKYLLLEPRGEVIKDETKNCKKIPGKE